MADHLDGGTAAKARAAASPVDPEFRARERISRDSRALAEIGLQQRARALHERMERVVAQHRDRIARIDALEEQRLRLVDVPDPGERALQ